MAIYPIIGKGRYYYVYILKSRSRSFACTDVVEGEGGGVYTRLCQSKESENTPSGWASRSFQKTVLLGFRKYASR